MEINYLTINLCGSENTGNKEKPVIDAEWQDSERTRYERKIVNELKQYLYMNKYRQIRNMFNYNKDTKKQ